MAKTSVIEVTTSNFLSFISSNEICVLKIYNPGNSAFSFFLATQFQNNFGDSVNFGGLDIQNTDPNNSIIQVFVKLISRLGMNGVNSVLPGYYLFKKGTLKAFHPATIDPNNIDPTVDGIAVIFGALAGIITGIAEKNTAKGFDTFFLAMEAAVSHKVYKFFGEILGAKSSSYSNQRQQVVYSEELLNAYKLLMIDPMSTDKEITQAYKKLQLKNHPDLHPNDITSKTKYCAELNNAYDLIKKSRNI